MKEEDLVTSSFHRLLKLSGLVGRVGVSMMTEKVKSALLSGPSHEASRLERMVENARLVAETLGKLKGAAMKVGQMLSLYEGLLPAEVSEILCCLQKETPSVPFEVMEAEVKNELKQNFDLFEHIDPVAHAAASIGQVHVGRLRDGRKVAVKIQYPMMDAIIKSDLKNLKSLLTALLSLFTNIDAEPVWAEMKDRLLEELDYRHEASNIRRSADLFSDFPEIVIPKVIDEASSQRVLTMEFLEGIPPAQVLGSRYSQKQRDGWGRILLEYAVRGIYRFRFLHADPNLANFAFLPENKVAVYDFGCMKEIPARLVSGYARLTLAAAEGRLSEVPPILKDMGILRTGGEMLAQNVTDAYLAVLGAILRESPPYRFGEDSDFYSKLFHLTKTHWRETSDIKFPQDVVFVDRTMSGHFGNLAKLGACSSWRSMFCRYAEDYLRSEKTEIV